MTVNKLYSKVPGSRKHMIAEVVLVNPYVVNGHAMVAADFGFTKLEKFIPFCTNSPLYSPYWDDANNKLQIAVSSTGAEAGAIDLSAIRVYGLAIGY